MVKDILAMKEDVKAVLGKLLALPEQTRQLALVRTKLEEACMWADYELRIQGVDPHAQPEVDSTDVEEPNEMEQLVSNM